MTGGYSGNRTVATVEAFSLQTNTWRHLPSLPAGVAGHAQLTVGVPRTYGGEVAGRETDGVMEMEAGEEWGWANVTVDRARSFASVSVFPGDLIHC